MEKVELIKQQIGSLSSAELTAFHAWYATFDAETWDRQFEADVQAGKLDQLADTALLGHSSNRPMKL